MTEPFFFNRGSGLSVREIAALTGAKLQSGAHLDRRITGIAARARTATGLAAMERLLGLWRLGSSGQQG